MKPMHQINFLLKSQFHCFKLFQCFIYFVFCFEKRSITNTGIPNTKYRELRIASQSAFLAVTES